MTLFTPPHWGLLMVGCSPLASFVHGCVQASAEGFQLPAAFCLPCHALVLPCPSKHRQLVAAIDVGNSLSFAQLALAKRFADSSLTAVTDRPSSLDLRA